MGHYDEQREREYEIHAARLEEQRKAITAAIQKTLDESASLAEAMTEILYDPWNCRR